MITWTSIVKTRQTDWWHHLLTIFAMTEALDLEVVGMKYIYLVHCKESAQLFLKNGPIPASFLFIFVLFSLQFQYKLKKA